MCRRDPGGTVPSRPAGYVVVYTSYIYSSGETMKTAKIFRNGQSQAVRLPKEFRFREDHVYVKKSGNVVLLIPARDSWDFLSASLSKFTDDFLAAREQPPVQKRERFPR